MDVWVVVACRPLPVTGLPVSYDVARSGDGLPGGTVQDDATARARKRLIIAAAAVLVAVITVLGVLQLLPDGASAPAAEDDPPPRELTAADVTNQFLNEMASGNVAGAAELTDNPTTAATQLSAVWQSMRPESVTAERVAPATSAGDVVDERFTLTWVFGTGRSWAYEGALRVAKLDAGWRVQWRPALVHPRLAEGQSLALREMVGQPAVVDRDGTPLMVRTPTGAAAADPAVAPLLMSGMDQVAGGQQAGADWYVALVDAAGADVEILYGTPPGPVVSTVSVAVQKAAQAAVDSQSLPAMLVAVQPSTGDLLAVAQNSAAGSQPVALTRLYPPGSTFKVVTAAALLDAGVAGADTVVPCPGSVLVGQRTVRNNEGFSLGDVPLRTAFAESCNTTFASQAAALPADALVRTADRFGFGADFDVPGLTTRTGDVPPPANPAEQVESSYGQGRVQTSCFGLALMSATVASGGAVTPRLWRDVPTTVGVPYDPPPAGVTRALRTMTREVVRSGTASALAGFGNVHGKTGTAQIGDGTQAHGWFAGYRDDLAFAVFVENAGASAAAVDVSGKFLGGLG